MPEFHATESSFEVGTITPSRSYIHLIQLTWRLVLKVRLVMEDSGRTTLYKTRVFSTGNAISDKWHTYSNSKPVQGFDCRLRMIGIEEFRPETQIRRCASI